VGAVLTTLGEYSSFLGDDMTHLKSSIKRRQLLQYGVSGAAFTSLISPNFVKVTKAAVALPTAGCCLMHGGESLVSQSRLSRVDNSSTNFQTSGNTRLDRSLGVLLADLAAKFKVRPGFGYFDDRGSPNALALPESRLSASNGTVLFGREMMSTYLNNSHGDMFIMGICAHEFAHIVQFFSGYYERLSKGQQTKKFVELHADFLSGYYIGLRKINYTSAELVSLGRTWESIGDSSYTDPQHHGTPEERLQAVENGYRFARERPEFGIKGACEVGARYLNV
jgi:hypothetical protein